MKAKIRNQYNQVPQLTRDTIWESDKNTIKHNTQEIQEVSHFLGCKEQQRQKWKGSTKEAPPWNGQQKQILEGLNMFNGTNLTLSSGVDQYT